MFEEYFDPEQIKFRGKPTEQRIPRVNAPRIHSYRLAQRAAPSAYTPGKQQRVAFKASYGNSSVDRLKRHVSYLERDSAGIDGKKPELFSEKGRGIPLQPIENESRTFRFILSPENSDQLDMKDFTRQFMLEFEEASGKQLQWLAAVHNNTAHAHSHIVVRGVDQEGRQFIFSRELLSQKAREIGSELATRQLGLRTDRDIAVQQSRDLVSDRFTAIDRAIYNKVERSGQAVALTNLQKQRLEFLDREFHLAQKINSTTFQLDPHWKETLERNGRQSDVVKTIENDLPPHLKETWKDQSSKKPLYIYQNKWTVEGKILTKGIADEMNDVPYAVIETKKGLYYYCSARNDLSDFKEGSQVKIDHGKVSSPSQHKEHGVDISKGTADQGNMPSFRKNGPGNPDQGIER